MPVFNWIRTDSKVLSRGGALVSGFRLNEVKDPYPNHESVDADQLWENLNTFLVPLSLKLKMLGKTCHAPR